MLWEKSEGEKKSAVGAGIIWERFPKFVLGFLAASIIVSIVGTMTPPDYVGKVGWEGKIKDKAYKTDFSQFQIPPELSGKMAINAEKKNLTFKGMMTEGELKLLTAGANPDQVKVLTQLKAKSNWFDSVLNPDVIAPIKKLRSWAFVLCFLCIGLSTRFAEMLTFGMRPFWAFTLGVIVNVPLGIILSTIVFVDYWKKI